MKGLLQLTLALGLTNTILLARDAVEQSSQAEKQKQRVVQEQEQIAQRAHLEIRGNQAFDDKTLRSKLKEQLATIQQYGLTNARGDDAAFFLELYYKKHGYPKVKVSYVVLAGNRLRLDIVEGPLVHLGRIIFVGVHQLPEKKLYEYAVRPTRERYVRFQSLLPFVSTDIEEGAGLVQRFYVSDGFIDCTIEKPVYDYVRPDLVDVRLVVHEGEQHFFGQIVFVGPTIYGAEALRGQILDLLGRPYTEARLADIPRRLQAYYKTRGYYSVKVDAEGAPALAISGRVPVRVTIDPGPVYYFDGVTVSGTKELHPSFLVNRFRKFRGRPYSPEALEKRFRELMRTSLFNVLQIDPKPIGNNLLRLDIHVEEAKPKEFGFSLGYGTYDGAIVGASYANRNLFGFGRQITTSVEYLQRGYKGEFTFTDQYLFDTDFAFKGRLAALTFDYDGYSKFELGGGFTVSRQIADHYQLGLVYGGRHVEVTSATISPALLGRTSYFVSSVGFTQTLDLRKNPFVAPRGLVIDNTLDVASSAIGSQIDFIRSTARVSYYIPFAPELVVSVEEELEKSAWQRWFERSLLAFGARSGIVYPLQTGGQSEAVAIPIDERFFSGGGTTVRSFSERNLGPHSPGGDPIGGEFFTIFNAEYTFPIYDQFLAAIFFDAGNLLPDASSPGLNDMRYAIGAGLRLNLPIGPMRLDYGVNPNPRKDEARGAFHFSFGFAF